MNRSENRGGRREGSGRRPTGSARVNLTVRVDPVTRERIQELRDRGLLIGQHVDAMVEALYKAVVENPNVL